jgi:hypothetical protein
MKDISELYYLSKTAELSTTALHLLKKENYPVSTGQNCGKFFKGEYTSNILLGNLKS